jgi:hypothetical protein
MTDNEATRDSMISQGVIICIEVARQISMMCFVMYVLLLRAQTLLRWWVCERATLQTDQRNEGETKMVLFDERKDERKTVRIRDR